MDASTVTSFWAVLAARWLPCFLPAAIKAGVLLGFVGMAAGAARRASAASRHLVWTMAIGIALLLPLLEAGLSPWQVPLPGSLGRMLPAMTALSPQTVMLPAMPTVSSEAAPGERPNQRAEERILPPSSFARTDFDPNVSVPHVVAPQRPSSTLAAGCLLVWLTGICALLAFRTASLLSLRTLRRTAEPLTGDGWPELLRSLAGGMGLRRIPDLLLSREASTPMTWGVRRPLILLPAGCRRWPEEERIQVLVHELAHVRRRDCLTSAIVQAACLVHWFNPLVWVAARQARLERERACDDRVLEAGIRPSLYADVLLRIARRISPKDGAAWAVPAMARRSQLYARLDSVLDPRRRRSVPGARRTLALGVGAAAVLLSLSLIGTLGSAAGFPGERQARSKTRWSTGSTLHSLSLTIEGDIRINEEASAIDSMAAGSSFVLEERNGFHRTRVEAHPDVNGKPVYAWKSGLRRKAFDDEARRWLAEKLADAYRNMAIDVEARVQRLYAAGGASAVLADLDKVDSDYARRQVLVAYFRLEGLTESDRTEGIRRTAAISSDFDRAEVLLPLGTRPLDSSAGAAAWLEAMDAFGSDFDRFRVLTGVQEAAPVSPEQETLLLRAARAGSSDYDRARFLEAVPAEALDQEPVRAAFFEALGQVRSAYDARQVLTSLAGDPRSGREALREVIAAVSRLDSDFDRAEVLMRVAPRIGADPQLRADGLKAAEGIHSDFDYGRVMRALRAGE